MSAPALKKIAIEHTRHKNFREIREVTKALAVHKIWANSLCTSIITGKCGSLKPDEVGNDERCGFGEWLRSGSHIFETIGSERHRKMIALHREFHKQAEAIITHVANTEVDKAERMMSQNGSYTISEIKLVDALSEWIKVLR